MKPEEEKGTVWLHCSFSDNGRQMEPGCRGRALGWSLKAPSPALAQAWKAPICGGCQPALWAALQSSGLSFT